MSSVPQDSELLNGRSEREDPLSVSSDADNPLHDSNNDEAIQSNDLQDSSSVGETSDLADPKPGDSNEFIVESHETINSPAANLIETPDLAVYKFDDPRVTQSQSNGAHNSPSTGFLKKELQSDKGGRTFTMRELLNELKDDNRQNPSDGEALQSFSDPLNDTRDLNSPYSSQDSLQNRQQYRDRNNMTMELINSVTGIDEEGRSHQRVLTFAARRFANAIERNPDDYDALYNWALVLQESADNVDPVSSSPSKDSLLEEACLKYEEATKLCPTLHEAYYNWAIAISDRAKMRGRTKEAEELWKQATKKYENAVQLNWNSPQALNNWGLALQELSAIVPAKEKETIVRTAISKFRAAIKLQFDFHRAIYNLGTLLYGLAEDTLRTGGSPNVVHSQCAIYIAAAHALKPTYSVYHSALKLVRSMLPLPYLKVGYLTAQPLNVRVAPWCDWKLSQFVLNHEALQQVNNLEEIGQSHSSRRGNDRIGDSVIKVDITDIVSVSECADLTLPGRGICIDTIHGEVYLVTDSWETLDGWLDAIRLVYTIFALGKQDVLAGILTA